MMRIVEGWEGALIVQPKGGWQAAHRTLASCPHHRGTCAYRVGDPDRCDFCHASWAVVDRWGEDRTAHVTAHTELRDKWAEKAATRAAEKPGQNGRQTLNGVRLG